MQFSSLPPPLKGTDGGFTHISIVKRLPQILDKTLQTIGKEDLTQEQVQLFSELRESLVNGSPVLVNNNPKDDTWDAWHKFHLVNNSWLESAWWYSLFFTTIF